MKFSVYCGQGIKMNTLAVAIGYVILMASISNEIWRRTLSIDLLFLKSYSVDTSLFELSLLALIVA